MDVHSSDKYRKFPPLVESSIDETDESSTQYDDDDDDDDGGGGSARGPTSTTAPSWSSNVVTMNFEGAFRGCSVSSCGTVGSSCCSSDDAALGQSLLRALVMRHRVRQDGDDCGTELLFGQQAAFRPRSPDPEQYTVVGDRRAFIIYDRTCYDIVAVPPNPEDWQPKQLRHHLDAVRAVAGVGFVVCLFRRLPKVRDREVEACSSVHTVAGDARKTAAASKYARSDAAAADGTLHVDLVAVSWTGFASEDDEHRTHSTTSGPSASLSRRQSLLRRAADLARHLAVAFHCPVLVAGAFHLSADEANAALTPPLKSAAGNESHEHQAGVSAVAEPVSGRRRRDKTPVATLTGADLVASTGSIGTGAAFSLRHHEVDDPSRHLRTSGSEFRFDSASGCGTGSDIRSKSCTAGTVSAAVFGNFSDEGDICPSRKDFEVSRRSRSRSPTGRTESDRHHSHGRRSPQATPSGDCLLRCYGYRTDTARRKLRSSQILICFAEPSLAARRVRPLRCGRLRVEVPIRRATTFTPRKTVDATRGRQRLRQGAELAKIAAHSASETAWREPEDYFYWDALSATVHVKTDVDGVLEASVNRLAEEMKTRSATIKVILMQCVYVLCRFNHVRLVRDCHFATNVRDSIGA